VGELTGAVLGVFASALRNRALRRVELSYGLFTGAEWAVWISLLVFAYEHGGASASSLIAITQLVPCALRGPLIGAFVDRRRPGRILAVGYAVQCATMAAVAPSRPAPRPPRRLSRAPRRQRGQLEASRTSREAGIGRRPASSSWVWPWTS